MKVEKIDGKAERQFITWAIIDDKVCASLIPNLDNKLLEISYSRTVAKWIKEYFDKYHEAPKKNIKKIWQNNKTTDDEDADEIKMFLGSISKAYTDVPEYGQVNSQFAIDESIKYLSNRNVQLYQEQLKNALDNGEDPTAIIQAFKPYVNENILPEMDTASNLLEMELPKKKYLVPGLFGWGLIMFCGTHKIGKSFMMLQLAVKVATGGLFLGKYRIKKARHVIYLCLEDGRERLQDRIIKMGFSEEDLTKLHLIYESRKGKEGLADLSLRLKQVPNTKLVIIDALATFRGVAHSKNIFQSDYDAIREIKKWADENKVAVLLVHHTRKPGVNTQGPVDIVDSVNGSNGLAAAADQTFIMTRPRKSIDGKLYMTSRDIEEKDLAIRFNINGGWTELGDADKVDLSNERRDILNILEETKEPMKTSTIAKAVGKSDQTVSMTLKKLVELGLIKKSNYGEYEYLE